MRQSSIRGNKYSWPSKPTQRAIPDVCHGADTWTDKSPLLCFAEAHRVPIMASLDPGSLDPTFKCILALFHPRRVVFFRDAGIPPSIWGLFRPSRISPRAAALSLVSYAAGSIDFLECSRRMVCPCHELVVMVRVRFDCHSRCPWNFWQEK